jgi:hypothetical protein
VSGEPSLPELGTDLGWKCKAVCDDGPAANTGIGRHVEEGDRVKIEVSIGNVRRWAVYESLGLVKGTPQADGVRLAFVSWENAPCYGRDGKPCKRAPVRGGYCDRHQEAS